MATRKNVIDMWSHLRKTNSTIPDEAISFMLYSCLEELKKQEINGNNIIYGVLSLNKNIEIEVMGRTTELELIWIDGQIGDMPIFESYDKALKYAEGKCEKIFKLDVDEKEIK